MKRNRERGKAVSERNEIARKKVIDRSFSQFKKNVKQIVKEFDEIPLLNVEKPKVGVVGEILVKYHPMPTTTSWVSSRVKAEKLSCRICWTSSCTA